MTTNPFTKQMMNSFCSTGKGGGVDPSCGKNKGGISYGKPSSVSGDIGKFSNLPISSINDGSRLTVTAKGAMFAGDKEFSVDAGEMETKLVGGEWRIMKVGVDEKFRNKGLAFDLAKATVEEIGPVKTSKVFSKDGKKFMQGLVKRKLSDDIGDGDYLVHFGK